MSGNMSGEIQIPSPWRHIFLSGPVQCGKSTVIRKTLALLPGVSVDGCLTFSLPLADGVLAVHIGGWRDPAPAAPDRRTMVGLRRTAQGRQAFPLVFDQVGVDILSRLQGQIYVLDELGGMETQAPAFRRQVMALLQGDTPILGVIKPEPLPLPQDIRSCPGVWEIAVTRENRDWLPPLLAQALAEKIFGRNK